MHPFWVSIDKISLFLSWKKKKKKFITMIFTLEMYFLDSSKEGGRKEESQRVSQKYYRINNHLESLCFI